MGSGVASAVLCCGGGGGGVFPFGAALPRAPGGDSERNGRTRDACGIRSGNRNRNRNRAALLRGTGEYGVAQRRV